MRVERDKVVGYRETVRGITHGTIARVAVASDAAVNIRSAVIKTAKEAGVDVIFLDIDKKTLGKIVNIERPAAVIGYLK